MSSLTLMELEMISDILSWLLDAPPAQVVQAEEREAQLRRQELEREAERRREEQRLHDLERQAEVRFDSQLRTLEEQRKSYAAAAAAERREALAAQNEKLEALKETAAKILEETAAAGAGFLADYANLVFSRDLYERVAEGRRHIADTARKILNEAQFIDAQGAEGKIADLVRRARELRTSWQNLKGDIAKITNDDQETAARSARFERWLSELGDGTEAMEKTFAVFPEVPEDNAQAHAEAVTKAIQYIRYYLFSPDSFYLSPAQKREVGRVYGISEDADAFSGLEPFAEKDIEQRNRRFEASHRRALDRHIFDLRGELRDTYDKYLRMRSRLEITDDPVELEYTAYSDADELLKVLKKQIASMTRKVSNRMQRELVQSVIDRALRTAKRGMSVRQLTEEETKAGNWKALYQLGQTGTTLEVYADARGQVTIEAGAVLDGGSMEPTDAQKDAIVRNNRHFCSSELPAIVERLEEELEACDQDVSVQVHETQGPDNIHIFDAARYGKGVRGALVLRRDGTASAQGASSAAAGTQNARYVEDDA